MLQHEPLKHLRYILVLKIVTTIYIKSKIENNVDILKHKLQKEIDITTKYIANKKHFKQCNY